MCADSLPDVSVVIPTHNRREKLPELLDALQDEAAVETIVVVNASNDGSMELLEARARDDAQLQFAFVEQAGHTRALQRGVEMASSEVVLLLDDDVVPEPGLVEGHARRHAAGENLVVLGYMPVSLPPNRRRGQFPMFLYADTYEGVCDGYERTPRSILEGLWAGNVSIRRADCLRVGLLPSAGLADGFGYHEDRDFGLRCRMAGLAGVFDRSLKAQHRQSRTPEAFLRSARAAGAMRVAIHAKYAETIGPLPPEVFVRETPMPGRLLVRWSARDRLRGPVMACLRGIALIAGTLHLFRLETHAGYVMGKIEQQRGALSGVERRKPAAHAPG